MKTRGLVLACLLLATSSTATATAQARTLVAADGSTPAAGFCDQFHGRVVTVRLAPDMPSPRCAAVRGGQELRLVDGTGHSLRIRWQPWSAVTLHPGRSVTFTEPFAHYLAKGLHEIKVAGVPTAELVYGRAKQPVLPAG